ncbi:2Fe-2S iron-sulfur cluster binding domain-containing protein [Pseudomonas gingeri]|uniref:2Fe-2S iron-sulfur cluster binding domain-containing protein n=1 Tax=Pseudomonas gingeri TaxID=117681 RepID=A0A7Y7XIP3_9PSED|nr:2Fe-2S iron-sulfur cluster-binding protein [Pseudomonas gingeri]NWB99522.1 2Fe-2S iron-sulfur cluster binding domain-containing protein [Pseudomonas gingeri]
MLSFFKKKPPFMGKVGNTPCQLHQKNTILDSLLEQGLEVPYSCQVGACQKCLVKVVRGRAKSLIDLSYCLTPSQIAQGYVLACQAVPQSDIHLDFLHKHDGAEGSLSARIEHIEPMNEYISRVTLSSDCEVQVGQSVTLTIPGTTVGRSYSIVNVSPGRLAVDVARRESGSYSHWLCDTNHVHQELGISAAFGQFGGSLNRLSAEADRCIAVAGGSGLGMVLGVLEARLQECPAASVLLLHAVRYPSHQYDSRRLEAMKKQFPAFDYRVAISREPNSNGVTVAERVPALLHEMFEAKEGDRLKGTEHFLMCGSQSLVNACLEVLKTNAVKSHQWEIESFGHH